MAKTLEVVVDNPPTPPTVWESLRREAAAAAAAEPALASLLNAVILMHRDLMDVMAYQLGRKLGDGELNPMTLREICNAAYAADPSLAETVEADLRAVVERDAACRGYLQPMLFFKGFLALQTHRVAHQVWKEGRETLAFHLQSKSSELFQVDIHPAAPFGRGVFIDHGTGIVVGETASVGDNVSMLQSVTLGGTGKAGGDRHPKIGNGVLIGAGAKVLGNINVGDDAKIASGSVVLREVPAGCTAAGVPARLVNCVPCQAPGVTMDQSLVDAAYDYVI
jgi:serine O-acetyltransferase